MDQQKSTIEHVLIVGCPRSGTTLLQSIVAAHPTVFSSPETHFFTDSIGQRVERLFGMPARSWRERQSRLTRRCRVALRVTNARWCRRRLVNFVTGAGHSELVAKIPKFPLFLGPAAHLYVSLGDQMARGQGKRIWLEKTPGHLHYLSTIDRYMPDAKVICVVRSAPDNIASLFDVAHKYPNRWLPQYRTIDGCIDRWLMSARAVESEAGQKNRLFVEYEDLAARPEIVAARVCRFIGVAYSGDMVEHRNDVFGRIVREREPHKQNVRATIESKNGTKFSELFTPEQQTYILSRLGDWPARLHALCERKAQASDFTMAPQSAMVGWVPWLLLAAELTQNTDMVC
jgi:hypothetical protein